MSDLEKEGVADPEMEEQLEVAQAIQTEDVQEERLESVEEKRARNDKEYNWAEARRKMQELENQNYELRHHLAQINEKLSPKPTQVSRMKSTA